MHIRVTAAGGAGARTRTAGVARAERRRPGIGCLARDSGRCRTAALPPRLRSSRWLGFQGHPSHSMGRPARNPPTAAASPSGGHVAGPAPPQRAVRVGPSRRAAGRAEGVCGALRVAPDTPAVPGAALHGEVGTGSGLDGHRGSPVAGARPTSEVRWPSPRSETPLRVAIRRADTPHARGGSGSARARSCFRLHAKAEARVGPSDSESGPLISAPRPATTSDQGLARVTTRPRSPHGLPGSATTALKSLRKQRQRRAPGRRRARRVRRPGRGPPGSVQSPLRLPLRAGLRLRCTATALVTRTRDCS
jgi:hypothetical protein